MIGINLIKAEFQELQQKINLTELQLIPAKYGNQTFWNHKFSFAVLL